MNIKIWLNKPFWKFKTGFKFLFWNIMIIAVGIRFIFIRNYYSGFINPFEIIYSILTISLLVLWIIKKIGKKEYEKYVDSKR